MSEEWNPDENPANVNFVIKNEEEKTEAEEAEGRTAYESYHISSHIPPAEPQKEKKGSQKGLLKKFAVCVSLAVVFGLVAGVCFLAVNSIGNQSGSSSQTQIADPVEPTELIKDSGSDSGTGTSSAADVAATAMPSLVAITNISVQEISSYFGMGSQEIEMSSSGSGIIVGQNDTELLIATNNHVVTGANSLSVLFYSSDTTGDSESSEETENMNAENKNLDPNAVEAQIKGTDAENDLAVIAVKLEDIPEDIRSEINVAQLGNSESLAVGEQVVAIGNALGYGQSVTSGVVSALNREITVQETDGSTTTTSNLIQTDAAINAGNSGGALLNMSGELIGINAAKYSGDGVEGMGYAIAISAAEPIINELMNQETRYKVDESEAAWMGIAYKNVDAQTGEMYGMPQGVFVAEATEGGPAQAAGMQKGDIITKIGSTSVSSGDELVNQLEFYAAGETIDVVVSRAEGGEYKEQTISVTLGNRSDMPDTSSGEAQTGE